MSIGDLELLDVDRLGVAELDVVKKGLGSPEVHLVLANGRVVLENQVEVCFPEVLRNVFEVGSLPDVGLLLGGQRLAQPLPTLLAAYGSPFSNPGSFIEAFDVVPGLEVVLVLPAVEEGQGLLMRLCSFKLLSCC